MIFKPKISHQKPIKPPLKADFNAYFTKKRMIFTPIYKICATPKGPFRVRFPAGVPNKKEPTGSFLFGFRCGSEPVVRPIAQQWHERRTTFGKPHAPICAKYSRREYRVGARPQCPPLRPSRLGPKACASSSRTSAAHLCGSPIFQEP